MPSFKRDVLPILTRHCAAAKDCHGEERAQDVELDLRPSAAYRTLVNAAAGDREGAVLVKPLDPASSFLLDKLTGRLDKREGKSMPLDPDTGSPLTPSPLPPEFLEGIVIPWILAGAPDN